MRMPITTWWEVEDFLRRCLPLSLWCLGFSVAALVKEGSVVFVGAMGVFLSGVGCGALLIFSWRHYHPLYSWLLWAAPGALLAANVAAFTLFPRVDSGAVSVVGGIFVVLGCGGLGVFGLLFLLRGSIKRWLGM